MLKERDRTEVTGCDLERGDVQFCEEIGGGELNAAVFPIDTDNDGTCDTIDADDDGDGVDDATEVADGTLPLNPDTDGDGATDGEEKACGTDATAATGGSERPTAIDLVDTDGDGALNCLDANDDGDAWDDAWERACASDPDDAASMPASRPSEPGTPGRKGTGPRLWGTALPPRSTVVSTDRATFATVSSKHA